MARGTTNSWFVVLRSHRNSTIVLHSWTKTAVLNYESPLLGLIKDSFIGSYSHRNSVQLSMGLDAFYDCASSGTSGGLGEFKPADPNLYIPNSVFTIAAGIIILVQFVDNKLLEKAKNKKFWITLFLTIAVIAECLKTYKIVMIVISTVSLYPENRDYFRFISSCINASNIGTGSSQLALITLINSLSSLLLSLLGSTLVIVGIYEDSKNIQRKMHWKRFGFGVLIAMVAIGLSALLLIGRPVPDGCSYYRGDRYYCDPSSWSWFFENTSCCGTVQCPYVSSGICPGDVLINVIFRVAVSFLQGKINAIVFIIRVALQIVAACLSVYVLCNRSSWNRDSKSRKMLLTVFFVMLAAGVQFFAVYRVHRDLNDLNTLYACCSAVSYRSRFRSLESFTDIMSAIGACIALLKVNKEAANSSENA